LFAGWLSAAVRDGQLFVVTYLMNNFSHMAHFSATFSLIGLQQVRSAAASGSFSY